MYIHVKRLIILGVHYCMRCSIQAVVNCGLLGGSIERHKQIYKFYYLQGSRIGYRLVEKFMFIINSIATYYIYTYVHTVTENYKINS